MMGRDKSWSGEPSEGLFFAGNWSIGKHITDEFMIECEPVKSLSEFVERISVLARRWKYYWTNERKESVDSGAGWLPWFRGEEDEGWLSKGSALRPKLYRNDECLKGLRLLEEEMRVAFRRCGTQLITERLPLDPWEWYFLMQHYGAPTRLLDWSDGALVALYFAVASRGGKSDKYGAADAVVYMIDPWWLNEQAFKEFCPTGKQYRVGAVAFSDWDLAKRHLPDEGKELVVSCPIAIDPSHFSRRIAAQRSRFTIFGKEPDRLRTLENGKIAKFQVKCDAIPKIKCDLKLAGISESTIFPDLEGLGRELSNWFQDNCTLASV